MKIYIYRPDMAKINPHLLFTPKGTPYYEHKDREKEAKDKLEELKEDLKSRKIKPFKIIL